MFPRRYRSRSQYFEIWQDGPQGFYGTRFVMFVDVVNFQISENIIFENNLLCFLNYSEQFGGAKVRNKWFWGSWSCLLGPKIMIMMNFLIFGKWNRKVTSPKWSRIVLQSFWATLFSKLSVKMGWQTTLDPKCKFSHFLWFSIGSYRLCFWLPEVSLVIRGGPWHQGDRMQQSPGPDGRSCLQARSWHEGVLQKIQGKTAEIAFWGLRCSAMPFYCNRILW